MADYVEKLKSDLAEQFRGKANIEALMDVIGAELQEVFDFFTQLRQERWLYTAKGRQLDGVGDIVVLDRTEAGRLAGRPIGTEYVLDDDTYRRYLIHKVMKNTCNCTYSDIMRAIEMFWKGPPMRYSEDPDIPATIMLDFDGKEMWLQEALKLPFVKAGGVSVRIVAAASPNNTINLYTGFAVRRGVTMEFGCDVPELP